MRIKGKYTFSGPRETVYELLQDPDALAEAMPGATSLEKVAEDTYDAQVGIRIGAIKGNFAGTVSVKEKQPPEHFKLIVEGQGAAGFMKGEGTIDLEEQEGGKTLIRYAGETQVGGRIAQVGQRLIQSVARKMINSGLKSLEKRLAAQSAA